MPFPSNACKTCKLRRVKCDETSPRCNRCVKAKRECHGMAPTASTHVYHLENAYASGQTKRPRGPRPTSVAKPVQIQFSPPQQALPNPKDQAIEYYLQYHLHTFTDSPDLVTSVWDNLLPTLLSQPPSSILSLAITAIALATYSRACNAPAALILASETYHSLLRLTQSTILSLNSQNIDTCLLAIYFMGRYEQVVHCPIPAHFRLQFPLEQKVKAFEHHDGSLAILKAWREGFGVEGKGRASDVVRRSRRGAIRSALVRDLDVPEWMADGEVWGEEGDGLVYDGLIVRVVSVRGRMRRLLGKDKAQDDVEDSITEVTTLNEELQAIDLELQDWASHFPKSWSYQKHTLPGSRPYPSEDFYSANVFIYSRFGHASIWNLYFGTRILVNATRLKIIAFLPLSTEEQTQCLSAINDMADNLAASIPFCREMVTLAPTNSDPSSTQESIIISDRKEEIPYMATLFVWQLSLATCFGGVSEEHKMWFRRELGRAGRGLCDRVLEYAETDQWIEL